MQIPIKKDLSYWSSQRTNCINTVGNPIASSNSVDHRADEGNEDITEEKIYHCYSVPSSTEKKVITLIIKHEHINKIDQKACYGLHLSLLGFLMGV